MADSGSEKNWVISFGPFRVTKARRLLERDGEPVHIGGRAFDILTHLLERPGQVVSRHDLLEAAWPGLSIDEGNLRFQMTTLRKALGEPKYIINVPGRGYCFAASISRSDEVIASRMPQQMLAARGAPPLPGKLIGREEAIVEISGLVRVQRIVTVVAPGGMGKTSIALAVASRLADVFRDRVCFVELAPVDDPGRVADTFAVALGLPVQNEDSVDDIVSVLKSQHMLLVVDGCEHVIDATAALLDAIVAATANIGIVVTSREALRIEHERVFQLKPLASPPTDRKLSAAEVLSYPAAQLFVERAGVAKGVISSDSEAHLVAGICSQLDGLALAIEIAASQAQLAGLKKLSQMMESDLLLTWAVHRATLSRHQTLGAMLERSYRLLSETEKSALRCLSAFSGPFNLEEARAVVSTDPSLALAELVSKSLLSVSRTNEGTQYRLLDTTRAYARGK